MTPSLFQRTAPVEDLHANQLSTPVTEPVAPRHDHSELSERHLRHKASWWRLLTAKETCGKSQLDCALKERAASNVTGVGNPEEKPDQSPVFLRKPLQAKMAESKEAACLGNSF